MLLPSEENIPAHQLYAYHIIEKIVTESRNLNKIKLATWLPIWLLGYYIILKNIDTIEKLKQTKAG